MRVALTHLRVAPVGGIERFLAASASHLATQGHEVTVLCREREGPAPAGCELRRLGGIAFSSGGRVRVFDRALQKHLQPSTYDVVLGLGKTQVQDVLRLGGGLHRVFLERTQQPGQPLRRLDRVSLEIEEQAFRHPRLRRVIVNSEMVGREVQRHFDFPASRIAVIHNGVDAQRYDRDAHTLAACALRQSLGIAADAVVFLFLGSGFHRKGLAETLEAFARLPPVTRLLLVGADHDLPRYREQARRLNIDARVCFLGERADTPVCYAAADVFVLPTRYDPFANATLEALASGLPVITSDRNGGAEVLTPGRDGAVVALEHGSEGLAQAMSEWSDPQRIAVARPLARATALRHPLRAKLEAVEALLKVVQSEKAGT
ncbi:MAG: glycosyltransferase family 4 protein [Pseudomonadota bacterium]